MLHNELDDCHREADKYSALLSASREQYADLESKYKKAKRVIKDFQDRYDDFICERSPLVLFYSNELF